MPHLPAVKRFVASNGVRIYRIPCQVFKELTARVYLLLGAGPPTLVDTGSGQGESTRDVLAGLDAVRTEFGESVRPTDLKRILITHGHVDHVGGLWDLLKITDAEVGIHPLDRRAVTAPQERAVVGKRRLKNFLQEAGVEPERWETLIGKTRYGRDRRGSIPVGISLDDGKQLDGMQFIHVPGHAPGHVCTVVGDVLLSADHVLARTVPQPWPESMIRYTGLGHYLDSLDKVRRCGGFDLALAGHEPVIRDVYKRIDAIRATHFRRLQRMVGVLQDAGCPLSIDEIATSMYSPKPGFHAVLALTDVGARVEYLHQRGQLTVANLEEVQQEENPVYRYRVA